MRIVVACAAAVVLGILVLRFRGGRLSDTSRPNDDAAAALAAAAQDGEDRALRATPGDRRSWAASLPRDGSGKPARAEARTSKSIEHNARTPIDYQAGQPGAVPVPAMLGGADFDTTKEMVLRDGIGISGDAGSISFCLTSALKGTEADQTSLIFAPAATSTSLQVVMNGDVLRFVLFDGSGIRSAASAQMSRWKTGEHHHIMGTWGAQHASLYVDGTMVDQQTYEGQLDIAPDTHVHVGTNLDADAPGARGALQNLQIYGRTLDEDEVGTLTPGCD